MIELSNNKKHRASTSGEKGIRQTGKENDSSAKIQGKQQPRLNPSDITEYSQKEESGDWVKLKEKYEKCKRAKKELSN
jgi:hypothetical protein